MTNGSCKLRKIPFKFDLMHEESPSIFALAAKQTATQPAIDCHHMHPSQSGCFVCGDVFRFGRGRHWIGLYNLYHRVMIAGNVVVVREEEQ